MTTGAPAAFKTVRECVEPAMAAADENLRDVRQAVAEGREAVSDCMAETRSQIRRQPLATLGVAVGVGALLGCMVGFALGQFRGRTAQ